MEYQTFKLATTAEQRRALCDAYGLFFNSDSLLATLEIPELMSAFRIDPTNGVQITYAQAWLFVDTDVDKKYFTLNVLLLNESPECVVNQWERAHSSFDEAVGLMFDLANADNAVAFWDVVATTMTKIC